MMKPRWKKVWSDLTYNKLRTLVVVLSIAVGVFAVGTMAGAHVIFKRDMTQSWNSALPASATIYADPFDEEMVESVRRLRGVGEAEGRRNLEVRVKVDADKWQAINLIVIPDYKRIHINKIKPVSGSWPPPEGEVLLERSSLSSLPPGASSIEIEKTDGKKKTLKIAGVVHDVTQFPTLFSGRLYGYISFDTLEALGEERKLDQINIFVPGEPKPNAETAHIKPVAQKAWNKIEQSDTMVYWMGIFKPGEHSMQDGINALLMLLGAIAALSLFLSAFLLINTISAIIKQQTRQIGIMKTIGGQKRQIIKMYMTLVCAYGLLSLLIATPLGGLASYVVAKYMADLCNFDINSFSIPLPIFLLELLIALLVPVIAAFYPVLTGVRVTVREAISDYGISAGRFGGNKLDKLIESIQCFSRPTLLSLRNTFRRKGRLLLTLLTLTVAGMVFVAVFSVRASLEKTSETALDYFQYNVSIILKDPHRIERISQEVLKVPGITDLECWGYASARILQDDRPGHEADASENVFVLATPSDTTMIHPIMVKGRWLLPEDENALVINTQVLKDSPNLKPGDDITLKIGSRKTKWKIVGLVQGIMTGPLAYANYPYFSYVTRDAGKAQSIQVKTKYIDAAYERQAARSLEQQLKHSGLKIVSIDTTSEVRDRIAAQFNILIFFLLMMAVLLAVVGGLGLMGTMSMNVLERTREIGVMRAIGASNLQVLKVFLLEGIIIGTMSAIAGSILALPLSKLLSDQVGMMFLRNELNFVFSITGVFIWFVIVIVLAALASFLPAWNASRVSVRDVLNYE